jgi:hypothetical protein
VQHSFSIDLHISHEQQGTYFTLPFSVIAGIEQLGITYSYPRRPQEEIHVANLRFTARPEKNIIDIGLIAPDGVQVGTSGSDKTEFVVSETFATPGYRPCKVYEGEWKIIVGAYKVAPEGVDVRYEIKLTEKSVRLLKGDLHVHTIASDGVHTVEELAFKAKANGLDFLAITDHNQQISGESLPQNTGVTLIPGVEWTHYRGHANFLGVEQPYEGPFFANTDDEAVQRFVSARQRGALITVNHPFEGNSSFQFDLKSVPFDCLEVWNGPMRESNLRAVGLWQQLLLSGLRVPICGGSDYHRDTPFIFLGGPTMCVYSESAGMSDILDALRKGHGYLTFAPFGPQLEMNAGESMMGDEVEWATCREIEVTVRGLLAGDEVKMITNIGSETLHKAETDGFLQATCHIKASGFARVEVARAFLPGLPMLPALLSNPIYFKG